MVEAIHPPTQPRRKAAHLVDLVFTDAGTPRNIEAGVLLHSPEFARTLLGQWRGLIASKLLRRVGA